MCFILFAMVLQSVTWRHSSAQQFRPRLTTTLTSQWLSGHSRISSLNRQREIKKILMLILSYTFLFARNHYHPTGIAKLFSTRLLSWYPWQFELVDTCWKPTLLSTHPRVKGPRSCIPHNFEILPERNVTAEDYCAIIQFFYRKGWEAQGQN